MRVALGILLVLLTACEVPAEPMRTVHEALAREEAAARGDDRPLADKALLLAERVDGHMTPEGLLAYRMGEGPPVALNSDTCAWTSYWAAACAWEYRVTGDPGALARLNRALRGLDHLARVSGRPGLLARTIVPADHGGRPLDSAERRWVRGVGRHEGVDYGGFVWRTDIAKAQLSAWLLAVHLGIELTDDARLREHLREDVGAVSHRIFHAGLNMTEADGSVERFGDLHPAGPPLSRICLTPCLSFPLLREAPWVPAVAPNAMVALGLARVHDHHHAGPQQYRRLARRDFDDLLRRGAYRVPGTMKTGNDHLSMLSALLLLETAPSRNLRDNLQKGVIDVYGRHVHDRNPLFTLVAVRAGALPRRSIERRLREARFSLQVYPLDRRIVDVDTRRRPGVKARLWSGDVSRTALPVNWLPSSSFLWKSQPVDLVGYPGADGSTRNAPIDYLVAYWLWRDMTRNDPASDVLRRVLDGPR